MSGYFNYSCRIFMFEIVFNAKMIIDNMLIYTVIKYVKYVGKRIVPYTNYLKLK